MYPEILDRMSGETLLKLLDDLIDPPKYTLRYSTRLIEESIKEGFVIGNVVDGFHVTDSGIDYVWMRSSELEIKNLGEVHLCGDMNDKESTKMSDKETGNICAVCGVDDKRRSGELYWAHNPQIDCQRYLCRICLGGIVEAYFRQQESTMSALKKKSLESHKGALEIWAKRDN